MEEIYKSRLTNQNIHTYIITVKQITFIIEMTEHIHEAHSNPKSVL